MKRGIRKAIIAEWGLVLKVLGCPVIRTVYIYGPPGTGKTYAAFHFGRVDKGVYSVTLTEETSAAEVRGHFLIRGGDSPWHDGAIVRAMREGKRLVLNELRHANADVLALLFPVLESIKTAELTLPTGEIIRPAPGFHVVCTDNHSPDDLPEALQDRFMATLRVTHPHPDAFDCLNDDLRSLAESALVVVDERRISARAWANLQLMLDQDFGLEAGCSIVFGPDRGKAYHDSIEMALRTRGT